MGAESEHCKGTVRSRSGDCKGIARAVGCGPNLGIVMALLFQDLGIVWAFQGQWVGAESGHC